jgi:hypothetical protein
MSLPRDGRQVLGADLNRWQGARPFGTKATFSGGALAIKTSIMKPNTSYALYWSNYASGPWTLLQNNISVSKEQYKTITDSSGLHPFYKFVQQ